MSGRPSRAERRALLLWIGLVMALGYRPGSPWAGIAAGAVAFIELALFLMLGQKHDRLTAFRRRL